MLYWLRSFYLLPVVCALLTLSPLLAGESGSVESNHGLALLYSVAGKEQDVDKLLWIKDPGKPIKAWLREIAKFNGAVSEQLEAWAKAGLAADLQATGLPEVERKARSIAQSDTTGELIISSHLNLRLELIVSQLKAMSYCANLCAATADFTQDEAISKQLKDWETNYTDLSKEGFKLLTLQETAKSSSRKPPTPSSRH